MMEIHEFKPIKPRISPHFKRADLEIYGIDHFRPSYTGLVFFNDKVTDIDKLRADDARCAGQFSVFGHEECLGDDGHCLPSAPDRFDPRRSHPLTRAFKRIVVTKALRSALSDAGTLQITIVASDVMGTKTDKKEPAHDRLFACEGLQIVTFS